MHRALGPTAHCRVIVGSRLTPAFRRTYVYKNVSLKAQGASSISAHAARPSVACSSTVTEATVDAEPAAGVPQTAEGAAKKNSKPFNRRRRPRAKQQRVRERQEGSPNRPLQVHAGSSLKACSSIAYKHLQQHSSMKAVAYEPQSLGTLLKALSLTQRYLLKDGKCVAMLDLQPIQASGGMRVNLALAGAQPLCSGTVLRVKRSFDVGTTARIIVAKVASSEPLYLQCAGAEASQVALQALAQAQARLAQLGYRTAVLPAYEKGPKHPMVAAGGFEPLPAPPAAADGSSEGGQGAEDSGDAATGGLVRSTPENSAVGALTLSVVLVEDPSSSPPPAPSAQPAWVRRNARAGLTAADLEAEPGAASRVPSSEDDSEAASTGLITLEVTQKVQPLVLADQVLEEVRQKGAVKLSVDPRACGLSLRALRAAGQTFQAPTRLLCDLAPSSRDGTYIINVTAASALAPVAPPAPPAPTPPAPDTPPPAAPADGNKPLGPLRVAASSAPSSVADALRLRLRVDGGAAVHCAYGQASQVAFAALVEARDQLQTSARVDLGFTVEQCEVTFQDQPMVVGRLLVETWPL